MLFVGTLTYKPNREGLSYFIANVLPLIHRRDPNVKLRIAGRTARNQVFAWAGTPGIEFLETVEDLAPVIEDAAIEICPLLYGLGTRIKILEALSFGKPVVSTTVGAYGIPLGPDVGLFRTDSAEEMAEISLQLLNDPDKRQLVGVRGRHEVALKYSQANVNDALSEIIRSVHQSAQPPRARHP